MHVWKCFRPCCWALMHAYCANLRVVLVFCSVHVERFIDSSLCRMFVALVANVGGVQDTWTPAQI